MATKELLVRLLMRRGSINSSTSTNSYRPSSSLSSPRIDTEDQFTFKSLGLPRVKEVHHPNRVKDNVLHPAFDIAIPEITYCEFLWSNLAMHEHLPGLVCGVTGRTLLHGEVKEQALKVSSSLRGLGLTKGDVVGVLLPNCIEYPLIVQGALHSGLTITPMNPAYTAPEISRQLKASNATVLITHTSITEKVAATLALYPHIKAVVAIGENEDRGDAIAWKDFLNLSSDANPEQVPIDLDKDVAVLPFSSGTTGVPKGVMLSQKNLVTNNISIAGNDPEYMVRASGTSQDVTIGVLPMYHIYGLNVTLAGGLYMGCKHIVLPSFKPDQFVSLMEKHKPTFLHLVPPLASFLANSPLVTKEHLTSLRQVNVGAAPSGPQLIEQFYKKAPKYVMYKEGWGSTEVAGGCSGINRAYGGIKRGSVNQLLPNFRIQIRDTSTDKTLGVGERGEIVLRGPGCMLGYSNNEAANKETFDEEGWMRTGDIGYYDDDGFIFIVDRMKELIKVKGLQVAPAELEDVLRGLEGVADVAVIGIPDERSGQVPRAYIVKEESLTEKQVVSYMAEQVSAHKQLAGGIEFVKAIPKSAAGKILRKELSAAWLAAQS